MDNFDVRDTNSNMGYNNNEVTISMAFTITNLMNSSD